MHNQYTGASKKLCMNISGLTLLVGRQDRHLACKNILQLSRKVLSCKPSQAWCHPASRLVKQNLKAVVIAVAAVVKSEHK